jgi:glyoxylase-like metal-dependent hydrolase (beta-lactamase superfamily II)
MKDKLQVTICPVTPFQQNCSLLHCLTTNKGAFVDPGGEVDQLLALAEKNEIEVEKIFVTHGHADHAGGVAEMAERLGAPVEGPHPDDLFWIEKMEEQGANWNMPEARAFTPDRWLEGGETVRFGEIEMSVRHCPGHTPGHVIFFYAGGPLAFTGDVIFQGSVGRTDFPRGDHAQLMASIRDQLWPLGNNVTFVPGHGPASTFGYERINNPFVREIA